MLHSKGQHCHQPVRATVQHIELVIATSNVRWGPTQTTRGRSTGGASRWTLYRRSQIFINTDVRSISVLLAFQKVGRVPHLWVSRSDYQMDRKDPAAAEKGRIQKHSKRRRTNCQSKNIDQFVDPECARSTPSVFSREVSYTTFSLY